MTTPPTEASISQETHSENQLTPEEYVKAIPSKNSNHR
jgi:hypothetical protein